MVLPKYFHMSLWAAVSVPMLMACGQSDDEETSSSRTVTVEVGQATALSRMDDDETMEEEEGGDGVKAQDIQQCRDVFTGTVEGWKVAGSDNAASIEATQAFAVKITGNENSLNLIIKAKEGATAPVSFPGVCLVLAGNKPKVQASFSGVALEHFKVVGNGNQGTVEVKLEGGATLPEGATEDLGKHVTVTVTE
ncbi:MAG TPA: hypothetical protein VE954_37680 [Oligoflexus sp.]|uniref:hypothetical protein n=1 Tax=Oligoflexus sp. TaxID=1971216 RepID=UPI002D3C5E4D|nr:hypothetical protein [Oligoflexus sp.]HYX38872.1 hypothetical protein [Oligoflexus sp.]